MPNHARLIAISTNRSTQSEPAQPAASLFLKFFVSGARAASKLQHFHSPPLLLSSPSTSRLESHGPVRVARPDFRFEGRT